MRILILIPLLLTGCCCIKERERELSYWWQTQRGEAAARRAHPQLQINTVYHDHRNQAWLKDIQAMEP